MVWQGGRRRLTSHDLAEFDDSAQSGHFVLVAVAFAGSIGMTNPEDRPPPAIGVYWTNEDDYPALLRIFTDGDRMPRTWGEWLKIAEEMESGLKAYGHVVMRVHIDPARFGIGARPTARSRS